MSFWYAIGDVIAVLGLFERVAIELRNYKDAPARFQQLSVKLDLLRNTLQHVLQLGPETSDERQTLEKIRAIVIHCLQPLQALDAKMQAKQGSLGHFRTTGTLRVIGSRLHWSMIAQKDVDELRKTVLSEMAAINILLSVQHMNHIKRLSVNMQQHDNRFSAKFDAHTNALVKQTSTILSLVAGTPDAIADLRALTIAQAEEQEQQARSLTRGMNLATCTREMLKAIGRNTRILLDITDNLKRIVRAIEAIPLHLTVGIIRFDDALGESWGLPIQACGSWDSFCDLLRAVVFANGRAGAQHVLNHQFVITLSRTGRQVHPWDWEHVITAGAHIEQAMLVDVTISNISQQCLRSGCKGSIANIGGNRRACSKCSQVAISHKKVVPILDFLAAEGWVESFCSQHETVLADIGPRPQPMPKMQVVDAFHCFHRVCITGPMERIQDVLEAYRRLGADTTDVAANRCVGLHLLQNWENRILLGPGKDPISYLCAVAHSGDQSDAETWYLLGRTYLNRGYMREAHNALQRAVWHARGFASIWITYDHVIDQPYDVHYCFKKCLELRSDLPDAAARIKNICVNASSAQLEIFSNGKDVDIIINPLHDLEAPSTDDEEWETDASRSESEPFT
ncbi:hypothetical protein O1611_g8448 [Lasiodiplodia mahajangana]|uniref:Uncharacterized protein n=1 Tax=Lasiodiplodia mahajangana TaxID=1108764 RepID=A0ACC2JCT0_9PEZI|nr:hypothetical protein O1611_g8448 [Lasiodiplodia mahajangana]